MVYQKDFQYNIAHLVKTNDGQYYDAYIRR